ncbi:MAG: hypothetical protein QOF49_98, partial [Chloroflexota bacterium]|nr:hypothetical protein [Chloroflexota bacterium]
ALARVDLRPVLARWRWVVAFAAVEIAVPWVALGSAEQHLSSSLAGLLIAGVPLVGTAFALATGGADRLSRTGLAGLLCGFVGVAAIVGSDFGSSDATSLVQVAIVVVGYAIGPAILARRLGGLPTVAVMALSLTLCAIVFAPIAAVQLPAVVPSPNVLASIAVLAVICTAAAFMVFAALVDEVGPVRATVITYVNPAVAAVLGVLVLHEAFTAAMALGFVLVIAGSMLATRRGRTTPPAAARLPSAADPGPASGGRLASYFAFAPSFVFVCFGFLGFLAFLSMRCTSRVIVNASDAAAIAAACPSPSAPGVPAMFRVNQARAADKGLVHGFRPSRRRARLGPDPAAADAPPSTGWRARHSNA